ncbi:MAG TPA: hypothetical protein VFT06_02470, partial [Flavisolibacter sp.]|nr:hypothetical protein [Flavisolibacter sp.]
MKGFFKRLSLPVKLTLLGIIPLLFLVFVVFQYNREKTQKLAMLDGYRQRIKQAISINTLIDVIQMERRYSFAFVMKGLLQNEMLQQRLKTDDAIRKVEEEKTEISGDFTSY